MTRLHEHSMHKIMSKHADEHKVVQQIVPFDSIYQGS